jgi:hypothetical protein
MCSFQKVQTSQDWVWNLPPLKGYIYIFIDECIDFNHTREPSPAWIIVYDLEFDLKPELYWQICMYAQKKKGEQYTYTAYNLVSAVRLFKASGKIPIKL